MKPRGPCTAITPILAFVSVDDGDRARFDDEEVARRIARAEEHVARLDGADLAHDAQARELLVAEVG